MDFPELWILQGKVDWNGDLRREEVMLQGIPLLQKMEGQGRFTVCGGGMYVILGTTQTQATVMCLANKIL